MEKDEIVWEPNLTFSLDRLQRLLNGDWWGDFWKIFKSGVETILTGQLSILANATMFTPVSITARQKFTWGGKNIVFHMVIIIIWSYEHRMMMLMMMMIIIWRWSPPSLEPPASQRRSPFLPFPVPSLQPTIPFLHWIGFFFKVVYSSCWGSSLRPAGMGEIWPSEQESKSPDPVNLSFSFLVQNTQYWTHFDIFDLILFMPEEGNRNKF